MSMGAHFIFSPLIQGFVASFDFVAGPSVSAARSSSAFACSNHAMFWQQEQTSGYKIALVAYPVILSTLGDIISVLNSAHETQNSLKYNLTALRNFNLRAAILSGSLRLFRFTSLGCWCSSLLIGYSSWILVQDHIPKVLSPILYGFLLQLELTARTHSLPANSISAERHIFTLGLHIIVFRFLWPTFATKPPLYISGCIPPHSSFDHEGKTSTHVQSLVRARNIPAVGGLLHLRHCYNFGAFHQPAPAGS